MRQKSSLKQIFISWHYAQRTRQLAKVLDMPVYEKFITSNIVSRHLFSSLWTLWILFTKKPDVVYVQMSFMLLLMTVIYKKMRFNKLIIVADCHTKSLRRVAKGVGKKLFWKLKEWSFNNTDISMIHNDGMIKDIEKLHKRYIVIPDKIPEIAFEETEKKNEVYCVYVSSFAVDEPFQEILDTAELLGNDITLYWTGKVPKGKLESYTIPKNVKFTGYISFEEYYNLLGNANCVLVLTTEEGCLQSGAYEALALRTPIVTSDTKVLREYFGNAALYTTIHAEKISTAIKEAIVEYDTYKSNSEEIYTLRENEFSELLNTLENYVIEDAEKRFSNKKIRKT